MVAKLRKVSLHSDWGQTGFHLAYAAPPVTEIPGAKLCPRLNVDSSPSPIRQNKGKGRICIHSSKIVNNAETYSKTETAARFGNACSNKSSKY